MAHDMSDTILTEIVARYQRNLLPSFLKEIVSVTFNNGGMHIEYSDFRISQIILKSRKLGKIFDEYLPLFIHKKIMFM